MCETLKFVQNVSLWRDAIFNKTFFGLGEIEFVYERNNSWCGKIKYLSEAYPVWDEIK